MGKSLQKLLSKYGIIFIQAGPMVNYHGIRAPYISAISNLEESVFMKSSHLFNYIVSPQVYQYAWHSIKKNAAYYHNWMIKNT